MNRITFTAVCIVLGFFMFLNNGYGAGPLNLKLEPNVVVIGASYNGTTLTVKGKIPKQAEAIVKIVGQRKDTEFKKKGRALGILWMNIGDVMFHNVPNLYLVYTGVMSYNKDIPVGFKAIKHEIKITPESEDKDFLFNEFIKLKKKEGLYAIHKEAVKYGPPEDGMKSFSCNVALPAKLIPGTYEVEVLAVDRDQIVAHVKEPLKVKEEGLPNLVASLAFSHGALYGVLATVIAIIAGLIMGLLFKGGKGGH